MCIRDRFYPVWCDLFRIPYETVPLSEDFCVNIRNYDKPNGGVVLPLSLIHI